MSTKPVPVCTGTFDPITAGHYALIKRAADIFGFVTLAVTDNTEKRTMFDFETRLAAAKAAFADDGRVRVCPCKGLIADFVGDIPGGFLLKGVRNNADCDYEMNLAAINKNIGNVETLFLPSDAEYAFISSTFVRDMIIYGRDYKEFVPAGAYEIIKEKAKSRL